MQSDKKSIITLEDKRNEEKKEWIKASFWATDNTPMAPTQEIKPPNQKL